MFKSCDSSYSSPSIGGFTCKTHNEIHISLQKVVYVMVVLVWQLLKNAIISYILRDFNDYQFRI